MMLPGQPVLPPRSAAAGLPPVMTPPPDMRPPDMIPPSMPAPDFGFPATHGGTCVTPDLNAGFGLGYGSATGDSIGSFAFNGTEVSALPGCDGMSMSSAAPMGFVSGGALSSSSGAPSGMMSRPRCLGGKGGKDGSDLVVDIRRGEPMQFVSAGTMAGTLESESGGKNAPLVLEESWSPWNAWGSAGYKEEELLAPGVSKAFGSEHEFATNGNSFRNYAPRVDFSHTNPPGSGCPANLRGIPGAPLPPPERARGRLGNQLPSGSRVAILMVAEKPAIAQAFAAALAPQQRYQKENRGSLPTFTFTGPWAGGSGRGPPGVTATSVCEYRITSTIGHVYSVDFPNVMRNWQRFDPEDLFDAAPVKKEASPDAELPQHLADEASRCHAVVLCLDCDREGEAIAYEALESVLPNLAKHPAIGEGADAQGVSFAGQSFDDDPRVWRAKFSSLAPNDLRMAMKSLAKPNVLESRSVDARSEIDLKVGIALSRLITMNLKEDVGALAPTREGESAKHGALLSYGPCQTPTLGFCVDRWDQIQNFHKQVSHTLDLRVRAPSGSVVTLSWVPSRELLSTTPQKSQGKGRGKGGGFQEAGSNRKDLLDQFVQRIRESGDVEVECESVDETPGIVERPVALNTVELLRLASRECGIDPQRALAVAEKLYLTGITTYPRTETTKYPSSFNVKELLVDHAEHKNWGSWCRYLLQGNMNEPREGHDAGDHPPITPVWCASEEDVKRKCGGNMARDAVRIYELISKHFVASVSPDVQYTRHEAFFDLDGFKFALKGNEVTDWGFARIMQGCVRSAHNSWALTQWNLLKPLRLSFLQDLEVGMKLPVAGLSVRRLVSTPPKLLTESELLSIMEKEQIGTDASMPTHVNNVVTRGYVEVVGDDRRMKPTILGAWLCHGLQKIDDELIRPEVRARIERNCTEVANGEKGCEDVVRDALEVFRQKFRAVRDGVPALKEALQATKEQKEQWVEKPPSEDQEEEQPPDDEANVVVAPAPLAPAEIAHLTKKRTRDIPVHAAPENGAPTKKRKKAQSEATEPKTPLEKLKAENKVLTTKLAIAELRAENAELKFREAERKHNELEARVNTLKAKSGSGKKRGRG